jgi:hypothetical protein
MICVATQNRRQSLRLHNRACKDNGSIVGTILRHASNKMVLDRLRDPTLWHALGAICDLRARSHHSNNLQRGNVDDLHQVGFERGRERPIKKDKRDLGLTKWPQLIKNVSIASVLHYHSCFVKDDSSKHIAINEIFAVS